MKITSITTADNRTDIVLDSSTGGEDISEFQDNIVRYFEIGLAVVKELNSSNQLVHYRRALIGLQDCIDALERSLD